MHVLYIHPNFPAQFGHIAHHLVQHLGWRATFVSQGEAGMVAGIEKIQYQLAGGARNQNHLCSRGFENAIWQCDAVYQALRARPDIKPDLIVGHSGFGSTLFLRELYGQTPIINFFEYYYDPDAPDSDLHGRPDLRWTLEPQQIQRARARNAMILLDLHQCDAGYTPTQFQRSRFPAIVAPKLQVIFDGIDCNFYNAQNDTLRPPLPKRRTRQVCGRTVGPTTRIVTYVIRGFESMRGFDLFIATSQLIFKEFDDVVFFVVGSDRICYGGDSEHLEGHKTFKDWTIARQQPDLSRHVFTGPLPPEQLALLLAASDLHIYLTVPFILSWSMLDAMACGAVVLGSDTAPVREVIIHEQSGLLAPFLEPEAIAQQALRVLRDPDSFRPCGRAAELLIKDSYSIGAVMPKMLELYRIALTTSASG